jgi:hypothetical protein
MSLGHSYCGAEGNECNAQADADAHDAEAGGGRIEREAVKVSRKGAKLAKQEE